jgi:hypothetical protein
LILLLLVFCIAQVRKANHPSKVIDLFRASKHFVSGENCRDR